MQYFVRRGSEEYGPYTLADLRRFVLSGHLSPTDGIRAENETVTYSASHVLGAAAWSQGSAQRNADTREASPVPIYQPAYQIPQMANGAPLPPNLHWAFVLLLVFVSCGLFPPIWALMQAWWARQISPGNRAIWYLGCSVGVLYLPALLIGMLDPFLSSGPGITESEKAVLVATGIFLAILVIASLILWTVGLLSIHEGMEQHFTQVEPTPEPFRLNPFLTVIGGMFYLQWHMSRIHRWKSQGVYE